MAANSGHFLFQSVAFLFGVATVREKCLKNDFFYREFCGWPGKFRKDLESQGKVREFENR